MNASYDQELFPFESRWITIEGNEIHYIDEGSGPTLLISHAPLGSSFMYREMIIYLRSHFRCIALDYPGFGLSTASPDYEFGIGAQGKIMERFIHQLGLESIYMLGHDTGGPSAFLAAMEAPHLVQGIIFTDTIIFPVQEYSRINRMLSILNLSLLRWLNIRTNFLLRVTLSRGIPKKRLSAPEKMQYFKLYTEKNRRDRVIDLLYSLKKEGHLMARLKKGFQTTLQQIPALLVYGEADPVHQMGITHRIKAMLQQAELQLIPGEGHFPHEGAARQMSAHILAWKEKRYSSMA